MLLDCPVCATSYHVSGADLEGGRVVICPRCDARWPVDAAGRRAPHVEPSGLARRAGADTARPASPPITAALLQRLRPAFVVTACLALSMTMIGTRQRVVRAIPRAAALYRAIGLPTNIRGLAFADVRPERLDLASPQVTITGQIRNIVASPEHVPRLSYEVRDASGEPLVSWTEQSPAKVVAAGHAVSFASLPHVLPANARSVLVRFDSDEAPSRLSSAKIRSLEP